MHAARVLGHHLGRFVVALNLGEISHRRRFVAQSLAGLAGQVDPIHRDRLAFKRNGHLFDTGLTQHPERRAGLADLCLVELGGA